MTLKLNGTNSEAAPAYAGDDADTGLQCGTNELKLVTGGSARATVDSSGNLGIGTVPSGLLTSGYNLRLNGGSQTFIAFNNSTHTTQATGGFSIGHDASAAYITQRESQPIIFSTNNTEEVRILSGGGLTFNGDTAQANALDDYEEGDWTPGVYSGGWASVTIVTAKYVKIGNFVNVQCYLSGLSGSGNSSSFVLDGLPYNSISNGYAPGSADFGRGSVKGTYSRTESANDRISFLYPSESSAQRINLRGNQLHSSGYIILNLAYLTSS